MLVVSRLCCLSLSYVRVYYVYGGLHEVLARLRSDPALTASFCATTVIVATISYMFISIANVTYWYYYPVVLLVVLLLLLSLLCIITLLLPLV